MGSKISLEGRFDEYDKNKCFLCSNKINVEDLVIYTCCNISLHDKCEDKISSCKKYIRCPKCNKPGSLGIMI